MAEVLDFSHLRDYQHLEELGIPEYMRDGILRYINQHVKPGDFLTAVICNDLKKAVWHADGTNSNLLKNYVQFFYNYAPGGCWGSEEKMNAWLERRD